MADFAHRLAVELWTLYSIAMTLVVCRILSRRISLGSFKNLQYDDYLMLFTALTCTADMLCINQVAINGSNFMSPEEAAALTPDEVDAAIWGSKMTLAMELFTLTTTWLVKACLLIIFYRLTAGLPRERLAVKIVACYCAFGYIFVVILFLTVWCHPIYEYWRVPVKYPQCASYYHHMINATTFNISSDLMILAIPIRLIILTQLPLKRKLVLCAVLCLGVFNILNAVLNRYYNFSNPNSTKYLIWYVAEVNTAVMVANIPLCWALLRKIFSLNPWTDSSDDGAGGSHPQRSSKLFYSVSSKPSARNAHTSKTNSSFGVNESEERITGGNQYSSERQASGIELTPTWHHNANYTTVRTEMRPGQENVEEGPHIVRTVEVWQY